MYRQSSSRRSLTKHPTQFLTSSHSPVFRQSSRAIRRRPVLANQLSIPAISLLFFCGVDSLAALGVPYWTFTFAVFYALLAVPIALTPSAFLRNAPPRPAYVAGCLLLLWSVPVLTQDTISLRYVLGDAGLISIFTLFFLYGSSRPKSFTDPRNLFFLATGLLLFSGVSSIVTALDLFPVYKLGARYDPPRIIVFAVFSVAFFQSTGSKRLLPLILLCAASLLAWFSDWRGSAVFGLTSIALCVACQKPAQHRFLRILVVLLSIVIINTLDWSGFLPQLTKNLSGTRYQQLIVTGKDDSIGGRIEEAGDVIYNAQNFTTPLQLLIGHGHGSTYLARYSTPGRNLRGDGRVHNIHIAPFLFFFRYGLVGLAVYLLTALLIIKRLLVLLVTGLRKQPFSAAVYTVSAALLLLHSLFYSPINDPVNIFTLAGFYLLGSFPSTPKNGETRRRASRPVYAAFFQQPRFPVE